MFVQVDETKQLLEFNTQPDSDHVHGPSTEVDRSSLLAQTKLQIVDKVGEQRARQHGEGDDVEHDTRDSDDGAAPRFVFESFASQRRSRQCCQKGHENGGAVRRVQVVESLPVSFSRT